MAISAEDINLKMFLNKFTYNGEPGKVGIPVIDFVKIAALLKLDIDIQRLVRAMQK